MKQRVDESHVEFAQRAMEEGEPDTTIEWTQTMSAAWVAALADVYPEGTSIQQIARASAIKRVMSGAVDDELEAACEDEDLEDLTESVDQLTGAIEGLAESQITPDSDD